MLSQCLALHAALNLEKNALTRLQEAPTAPGCNQLNRNMCRQVFKGDKKVGGLYKGTCQIYFCDFHSVPPDRYFGFSLRCNCIQINDN